MRAFRPGIALSCDRREIVNEKLSGPDSTLSQDAIAERMAVRLTNEPSPDSNLEGFLAEIAMALWIADAEARKKSAAA